MKDLFDDDKPVEPDKMELILSELDEFEQMAKKIEKNAVKHEKKGKIDERL
jgi:hypothetical protein